MNPSNPSKNNSTQLILYFILAYAFSWLIGIPLALANQDLIPHILPKWTHYLVGYGPLLAALLTSRISEGRDGAKRYLKRIIDWKAHPLWWLVALSPLIIGGVVILILNLTGGNPLSLADLGEVNFLPPLGIGALFLWLFTFGIGEESGWRGFALPRLQRRHSALSATLILSLLWGFWHTPQFFYLFDPAIAIGWAIGLFAGAIVFTWLFNSSGGIVPVLAVWHGCFNFISASDAGNGVLAAVVSTLVMVWAVLVLVIYKPANLSRRERIRE